MNIIQEKYGNTFAITDINNNNKSELLETLSKIVSGQHYKEMANLINITTCNRFRFDFSKGTGVWGENNMTSEVQLTYSKMPNFTANQFISEFKNTQTNSSEIDIVFPKKSINFKIEI